LYLYCSSLLEKVEATRVLYPGLRYTILVEGQPAASSLTWDQFMASSSGPLPLQEPVDIHKVTNHLISLFIISYRYTVFKDKKLRHF
jgi:hypothetical protein